MKFTLNKAFIRWFFGALVCALAPAVLLAQGVDGVDNNAKSHVRGNISQVSNYNNILVVAFKIQSDSRRLANATFKFTYDERVLKLEETPLAETPRDTDNLLSSGDYFFHNQLNGKQDNASSNNGYDQLTLENGKLQNGTNELNEYCQITIWNSLMDESLNVLASDTSKLLNLNQEETILTLKFKIIGTGLAGFQWLNEDGDYEVIVLNKTEGDNQPSVELTSDEIFVTLEEEKYILTLASTGIGTEADPVKVNVTSREAFDVEAGSAGFYVYYNTANTTLDASKTIDLLNKTTSFNWSAANIVIEEIPLVYRSFTPEGSTTLHESYYNTRIKFVSNAGGVYDDMWSPSTPTNTLSLVFNEVVGTKGSQPIDIYLEAITGQQGATTTFKSYAGAEHGVVEQQRVFPSRDNTLPVSLTHFTAAVLPGSGHVELNWTTANEKDNKEFVVERSTNAKEFTAIDTLQGGGNSNVLLHYTATDRQPLTGITYYRLKQIDFDGKFEYSKVVVVNSKAVPSENQLVKSAFPNPFKHEINLKVTLSKNSEVLVELVDLAGKKQTQKHVSGFAGEQIITLPDLGQLPAGLYLIKVTSNGQTATYKLVKRD